MKVDPEDYDKRYSSPITQAIISGHLDIVQYLISHGASLAVSNKKHGFTPLHLACIHGHLSLVQYFIEDLHMNPNVCLQGTRSAISQAAIKGHQHILEYLVKQGASLTLADKTDFCLTPFHWACLTGHLSLVKWMVETQGVAPHYCEPGTQSAISQAAIKGHQHILEYLVKQGASLTLADKTDFCLTPFHWACRTGHLSLVKWMIETQGVDPDYCEPGTQSAISQAAIGNQQDVLEYLIDKGASLILPDKTPFHTTPLDWACQQYHLSLVQWCIRKKGTDLNLMPPKHLNQLLEKPELNVNAISPKYQHRLLNTVESYLINSALSMNYEDLQELYHTLVLFDYKWHRNSVSKVRKIFIVSLPDIKTESKQDDIDMFKTSCHLSKLRCFFCIY